MARITREKIKKGNRYIEELKWEGVNLIWSASHIYNKLPKRGKQELILEVYDMVTEKTQKYRFLARMEKLATGYILHCYDVDNPRTEIGNGWDECIRKGNMMKPLGLSERTTLGGIEAFMLMDSNA